MAVFFTFFVFSAIIVLIMADYYDFTLSLRTRTCVLVVKRHDKEIQDSTPSREMMMHHLTIFNEFFTFLDKF